MSALLLLLMLVILSYISFADDPLFPQSNQRGGNSLNMGRNGTYDYVPSIIYDSDRKIYRMWWCGGSGGNPPANFTGGDHILYAEASSLDGPWHSRYSNTPYSYDLHLSPNSDNITAFDYTHTCDPSVIKIDNMYYLYYGGGNEKLSPSTTRVGIAYSMDGYPPWTRTKLPTINDPLGATINPAWVPGTSNPNYGCGQPSVFWSDPYVYMVYTDLSGKAQTNVNVVYVLRSKDPKFMTQSHIEELGADGFYGVSINNGNITGNPEHTSYYFSGGASVDWVYVKEKNMIALGVDGPSNNETSIWWWDINNLNATHKYIGYNFVNGIWTEGPGIVHNEDGTGIIDENGNLILDVMRSVSDGSSTTPWSWWLSHDGVTLNIN